MKYQFCIRFSEVDANSAASKAVLDCNTIFLQNGYKDFTFTVGNNANRARYYALLLKNLLVFFFRIKRGSSVGVQYPLLSINNVFKYFIALAHLKKVSFFCVVHDLHSLRTGGKNPGLIRKDIANLSRFNRVIVHNPQMLEWLRQNGLRQQTVTLGVFDYLCEDVENSHTRSSGRKMIVYAGNLAKSKFIYSLHAVKGCRFRLYGPGYEAGLATGSGHVAWMGQYSPEQIPKQLQGDFGLIWDGESCTACDEVLGNYLQYNAPHKFSLYIAAGLPVIAPAHSAIGVFITTHNIGVLVNNLHDLETLTVGPAGYAVMKSNVLLLRKKIINGHFFTKALREIELRN